MLQHLLANRFKLAIHKETKPLPMFLRRWLPDAKLGPGLRKSTAPCEGAGAQGRGVNAPANQRVPCGLETSFPGFVPNGTGSDNTGRPGEDPDTAPRWWSAQWWIADESGRRPRHRSEVDKPEQPLPETPSPPPGAFRPSQRSIRTGRRRSRRRRRQLGLKLGSAEGPCQTSSWWIASNRRASLTERRFGASLRAQRFEIGIGAAGGESPAVPSRRRRPVPNTAETRMKTCGSDGPTP